MVTERVSDGEAFGVEVRVSEPIDVASDRLEQPRNLAHHGLAEFRARRVFHVRAALATTEDRSGKFSVGITARAVEVSREQHWGHGRRGPRLHAGFEAARHEAHGTGLDRAAG